MIKAECTVLKNFLWASLVVTLLSTLYWLLGVSGKLKVYLDAHHKPVETLTYFNVFFVVILPVIGFTALLTVHFRLFNLQKFRRHDTEINKLKRFRNLLLLGFIFLMGRGLVFLIFSA